MGDTRHDENGQPRQQVADAARSASQDVRQELNAAKLNEASFMLCGGFYCDFSAKKKKIPQWERFCNRFGCDSRHFDECQSPKTLQEIHYYRRSIVVNAVTAKLPPQAKVRYHRKLMSLLNVQFVASKDLQTIKEAVQNIAGLTAELTCAWEVVWQKSQELWDEACEQVTNGTEDFFRNVYYCTFLDHIFPRTEQGERGERTQFAMKPEYLKDYRNCFVKNGQAKIYYSVEYVNLYVYNKQYVVFAIRVQPHSSVEDLHQVLAIARSIRSIQTGNINYEVDGCEKSIGTYEMVFEQFLQSFNIPRHSVTNNLHSDERKTRLFTPNLKIYLNADLNLDPPSNQEAINEYLIDLGNLNLEHAGTNPNYSLYKSSQSYSNRLLEQNSISLYDNWRAIALFDNFCRVSFKVAHHDKFRQWDQEYFYIYLHCLFTKFYMFDTNYQMRDVVKASKALLKSRDEFVEFINDYHLSHISFKFIQNEIYQKIRHSLDTDSEITKMEEKIGRIAMVKAEQEDKWLRNILGTLTGLSLISIWWDGYSMLCSLIGIVVQPIQHLLALYIVIVFCITVIAAVWHLSRR